MKVQVYTQTTNLDSLYTASTLESFLKVNSKLTSTVYFSVEAKHTKV